MVCYKELALIFLATISIYVTVIHDPACEILVLNRYVRSQGSDKSAQRCSLSRALAARKYKVGTYRQRLRPKFRPQVLQGTWA